MMIAVLLKLYLTWTTRLQRFLRVGDRFTFSSLYVFGVAMLLLSHFSRVRLCATPSLGFSRQEHWSGLPFPSPMHKSEK